MQASFTEVEKSVETVNLVCGMYEASPRVNLCCTSAKVLLALSATNILPPQSLE